MSVNISKLWLSVVWQIWQNIFSGRTRLKMNSEKTKAEAEAFDTLFCSKTEQCVKMWPNFGQKKYYIQTLFAAQQKSQQPAAKPAAFGIDPMLVGQPFTTGTYP